MDFLCATTTTTLLSSFTTLCMPFHYIFLFLFFPLPFPVRYPKNFLFLQLILLYIILLLYDACIQANTLQYLYLHIHTYRCMYVHKTWGILEDTHTHTPPTVSKDSVNASFWHLHYYFVTFSTSLFLTISILYEKIFRYRFPFYQFSQSFSSFLSTPIPVRNFLQIQQTFKISF